MKMVLYALIPVIISSIYYFGFRSLSLLLLVSIAGYVCEYLFVKNNNLPVHSSIFVTCALYTLTLPPTVPYWIAVLGIIAGVVFGKMAFGGFGRNVFNPALLGRAFIYVSFGNYMTNSWVMPLGFGAYQSSVITEATPLAMLTEGHTIPLWDLFVGNISGCLGETNALLLIIGGFFLLLNKIADYRIVLSGTLGMLGMNFALNLIGIEGSISCLQAILSGGFLLGIFFMATDPVSASSTKEGKWVYGCMIGVLTVLIRYFSIWPEGIMFAILISNMFIPIIDIMIKTHKNKGKEKKTI